MPVDVRLLGPDDRDALERFLLAHADSSLFLRSNVRAAGLVDDGRPFSGTYAGAFDGGLRAVAAHYWNGNVIVQAPVALALDDLVRPPALDAPGVRCRATRADDLDLVAAWRIAYAKELMHATDGSRWVLELACDVGHLASRETVVRYR